MHAERSHHLLGSRWKRHLECDIPRFVCRRGFDVGSLPWLERSRQVIQVRRRRYGSTEGPAVGRGDDVRAERPGQRKKGGQASRANAEGARRGAPAPTFFSLPRTRRTARGPAVELPGASLSSFVLHWVGQRCKFWPNTALGIPFPRGRWDREGGTNVGVLALGASPIKWWRRT